jgi:hypothetical protein
MNCPLPKIGSVLPFSHTRLLVIGCSSNGTEKSSDNNISLSVPDEIIQEELEYDNVEKCIKIEIDQDSEGTSMARSISFSVRIWRQV